MGSILSGMSGASTAAGGAQGGMALGDAGSAYGGGYESMMSGNSPYQVPGAGGVDTSAAPEDDTGLLQLLAQSKRPAAGGDWAGFGRSAGQGANVGLAGLMGMGNRNQARNQSARQAYKQGLLGG